MRRREERAALVRGLRVGSVGCGADNRLGDAGVLSLATLLPHMLSLAWLDLEGAWVRDVRFPFLQCGHEASGAARTDIVLWDTMGRCAAS